MRNVLVSHVEHRRALRLGAVAWVLSSLCVLGCGNPEEGTVKVDAAARQRLTPTAGPKAKTRKGEVIAGKSFSIKDRAPVAPPK